MHLIAVIFYPPPCYAVHITKLKHNADTIETNPRSTGTFMPTVKQLKYRLETTSIREFPDSRTDNTLTAFLLQWSAATDVEVTNLRAADTQSLVPSVGTQRKSCLRHTLVVIVLTQNLVLVAFCVAAHTHARTQKYAPIRGPPSYHTKWLYTRELLHLRG